jgi:hypothetical protein
MQEDKPVIVGFRTTREKGAKYQYIRKRLRKLHGKYYSWEAFFDEAVDIAFPFDSDDEELLKGGQTHDRDTDES